MRRIGLIIIAQLIFLFCHGQNMDLKELTELLDIPTNRLDNALQKKGFRKDAFRTANEDASLSFIKRSKNDSIVQHYWLGTDQKGVYETTCPKEFLALKTAIKTAGYSAPKDDAMSMQRLVYQKQVITIETSTRTEDSTVYYILKTSKKDLPKKKEMVFAEDLLYLDSHEYLCEMFGKANVKQDVFFFAEDDSSRCSVVFPKSNREAIIVWKDEENYRKIAFVVVGGHVRSSGEDGGNSQSFNIWRSKQGVYCGMSLRELEMLNKEPVKFYNWHTEASGYLIPKNKGAIDFEQIGIVLNCMNCSFIKVSTANIMDSQKAVDELQKVFVTSLIIVGEKK